MPKYTYELKLKIVEDIKTNYLPISEAATKYSVSYTAVNNWYKIFLTDGPKGLAKEHRGRNKGDVVKGRPATKIYNENNLAEENMRLRMEIAYLKKLNALTSKKEK